MSSNRSAAGLPRQTWSQAWEKRFSQAELRLQWNLPTLLTLARLFLVPFQVFFLMRADIFVAGLLYGIAVCTDMLDGYFARRWNQRTIAGAALDPLVDKITILSMFVSLIGLGIIPVWLALLVIARDFFIILAVFILIFAGRRIPWRAIPIGKLTTICQNVTVLAAILLHFYHFPMAVFWGLVALTAGLTIASWVAYFQVWRRIYFSERDEP